MRKTSAPGRRPQRVAEQIRQVAAAFLQEEARDPRIGLVTITAVHVTGDLQHADLRYVVHGGDAEGQTQEGLDSAVAAIRRRIGHELRLRVVPGVTFTLDRGAEHASRIEQLLSELKKDENG
jgi:ribosome-binding factor A